MVVKVKLVKVLVVDENEVIVVKGIDEDLDGKDCKVIVKMVEVFVIIMIIEISQKNVRVFKDGESFVERFNLAFLLVKLQKLIVLFPGYVDGIVLIVVVVIVDSKDISKDKVVLI